MEPITVITPAIIIAIVIGLAEAIKRASGLNSKFVPVLDIVLGILGAVVYSYINPISWAEIIIYGLVMGLSACGLFSATKNVVQGIQGD